MTERLLDWVTWAKLAAAAVLSQVLEWPEVLRVLAVLQVLDIVTGIIVAAMGKKVQSEASYIGMLKKGLVWLLILMVGVMEGVFQEYFPTVIAGLKPFELVAAVFGVTEAISILENMTLAGIPIPQFLTEALKIAQKKLDPVQGE